MALTNKNGFDYRETIKARLEDEEGTIFMDAPHRVALVYPSPYHVGMSSLGFQTIYRRIHEQKSYVAHRAFLPEDVDSFRISRSPLLTYEFLQPVSEYSVIAFSVAYEGEIAGIIQCLELSQIPALREERDASYPIVIAGGPLTFSNPLPLAPFFDVILMGEADESIEKTLNILFLDIQKDKALDKVSDSIPSAFVPKIHGSIMPPVEKASESFLPARSQIITPNTELRSMFLIEPERGCHRGCTYCVMRRSTNDGMRVFDADTVLSLIPDHVKRVGLVGAATTDHPKIVDIVENIVDRGLEVGLSSLRADRLTDRFVAALRRGGQTVLTTASDGPSQRLRDYIQRKNGEDVLIKAAELTRKHHFLRMKLYMMIGLPSETDEDIEELIQFSIKLSKIIPLSLGIAPFVAKRNTPLDGEPFAGIDLIDKRLDKIRKGVKGRVDIRGTSARWAWIEYVLAQGAESEGRAVMDAVRRGGRFRDYKDAFEALPKDRERRALVKPGNKLGRALPLV